MGINSDIENPNFYKKKRKYWCCIMCDPLNYNYIMIVDYISVGSLKGLTGL